MYITQKVTNYCCTQNKIHRIIQVPGLVRFPHPDDKF